MQIVATDVKVARKLAECKGTMMLCVHLGLVWDDGLEYKTPGHVRDRAGVWSLLAHQQKQPRSNRCLIG
jgi:hypothetical protein